MNLAATDSCVETNICFINILEQYEINAMLQTDDGGEHM
jgi:hypothetical protein